MAEYPQKTLLKVQMRGIHFGSQITHLEESTKTNPPLNRTLVFGSRKNCQDAVTKRGGYCKNGMSAAVDYLVISSNEDNVNAYTSKVRDFERIRFNGHTSQIITEEKWASFL